MRFARKSDYLYLKKTSPMQAAARQPGRSGLPYSWRSGCSSLCLTAFQKGGTETPVCLGAHPTSQFQNLMKLLLQAESELRPCSCFPVSGHRVTNRNNSPLIHLLLRFFFFLRIAQIYPPMFTGFFSSLGILFIKCPKHICERVNIHSCS